MDGAPTDFWGKLDHDAEGRVLHWHPLVDHCADVAACAFALLERSLLRKRLARLGGLDDLTAGQVARLGALAAMHDLGKTNQGFQARTNTLAPKIGHVGEFVELFHGNNPSTDGAREQMMAALEANAMDSWVTDGCAAEVLLASVCHHGRPVPFGTRRFDPKLWQARGGLDPFEGMGRIARAARRWFPEAWNPDGAPLPGSPAFQHAFSGLVMLADWLGSDTDFFPFSQPADPDRFVASLTQARTLLARMFLDPERAREDVRARGVGFSCVSPYTPNAMQATSQGLPCDTGGSLTVLEAETGSGKTEAALARFLVLFHAGLVDGMYFALPTRTAATQLHARVTAAVASMFSEGNRPPVVLAVAGYLKVDDTTGTRLPAFKVLWNDARDGDAHARGWAAENPKRYLAGPIVVGTIDQVLLAALTTEHAHLRATALSRQLLVVDEVHASDAYMTRILQEVLKVHRDAGGHALLMSATLGSSARVPLVEGSLWRDPPPLEDAVRAPYPLLTHRPHGEPEALFPVQVPGNPKRVFVAREPWLEDPGRVAQEALAAALKGARVLVVRNTVNDAIATQEALERLTASTPGAEAVLFRCEGVPAPHHARFASGDRKRLDEALERRFGRKAGAGGCVVIATQTVQQALDIDADLLLTDLCPMDVLLQRLGRLHRHPDRVRPEGFHDAHAVVLVDADSDLSRLITKTGRAQGRHGFGTVYEDLRVLFATRTLLEKHPTLDIPGMNRKLVEGSTHPEALSKVVGADARWRSHQVQVLGAERGKSVQASFNLLDRSRPFGEAAFPDDLNDHRIATRLGLNDRVATFDPPVDGPFGRRIWDLHLPAWLVGDAPSDAAPEDVTVVPGAVFFRFGDRAFQYDRLGVRLETGRPATTTPAEDQDHG
ncbi:MAG: CRISPR-associated helicase Cas3' [Deltaproteobacteria bacterium]|nr:CRISPR-associated helicase Cas3' [Deltaproteobacteria bacterium]